MQEIEKCDKIIVFADKSTNIYKMEPGNYNKMLKENVTESYKKIPDDKIRIINQDAFRLVVKNKIKGKIPALEEKTAFVTIKDHKKDFPKNVNCRLINPAKSHLGKVSKIILDKINAAIREKTKMNQWKNTREVI